MKNTQNQRRLLRLIGGLCLLSVSGFALESAHAQQFATFSGDVAAYGEQAPAEKSTAATAATAATPRKPVKRSTVATAVATTIPSAAPAPSKPMTATASIAPSSDVVSATSDAKPAALKRKPVAASSTKLPYYVDFRARTAASYGHAFVWYGKTSDKKVDVAGLHPKGDEAEYMLGHLTWVPAETGASYGDLDEEYLTANYRVYLSEEDAKIVFAHIKELQATSHWWNAQTNNCTSFVGKIASFMGLKTPFHLVWPENYIKQMKEMNGGRTTVQLSSKPAFALFN